MELGQLAGVEGFLHCNELHKLVELAANRDVLEIGAFRGLSAWGMAITAKSVTSIDTFRANSAGQVQQDKLTTLDDYLRATERYKHVHAWENTSEGAHSALEKRDSHDLWDFVFLDAMHTYEDVKADIARWWPRVRSGGVFAMHDYGHGDFPGVKQAADEFFGPAPEDHVVITLRWIEKP